MIHEHDISNECVDLVCGLHCAHVKEHHPVTTTYKGKSYTFCGEGCLVRFEDNPEKYFGEPLIHVVGAHKTFKTGDTETHVLKGIDLHIWEGDFISIIGSSGSGKSTLLNILGLLDKPTEGTIFIKGRDAAKMNDSERALFRSKTFGFVFQQYNLIPWLTAYENVTTPNIFAGQTPDRTRIMDYFTAMGIDHRSHHLPTQLSGGEQQRVALIRAIANDPAIIFGDEPTGNLDSKTGDRLLDMLIDMKSRLNKTLVVVTHDRHIAEMANDVVMLRDGEIVPDSTIHKKSLTG